MEALIAELVDMRDRTFPGSVSRRLADRCLELCFQEITANDEPFELPPLSAVKDLVWTVLGGR